MLTWGMAPLNLNVSITGIVLQKQKQQVCELLPDFAVYGFWLHTDLTEECELIKNGTILGF